MSRLSRIFRSCDVRSARKEVHRGYSGGALRTTKVLACEDKGEEGGGENEKEKELGFGEESLDDLCEDTKFLMDCMIPERQRKYFDFRDSKLTFVDFLYRLPHFGEGRRLTRRKWLMMNLHDTYMTVDRVRFLLDEKGNPFRTEITGLLTWKGKQIDLPTQGRDFDKRWRRGEWRLWYPNVVKDYQEVRKKHLNIPDGFPTYAMLMEKQIGKEEKELTEDSL